LRIAQQPSCLRQIEARGHVGQLEQGPDAFAALPLGLASPGKNTKEAAVLSLTLSCNSPPLFSRSASPRTNTSR
jgi:hypothetical protein